jgi:fluoride exporter
MPPMILIFLGGGTGAVCRYALNNVVGRGLGLAFPYGTLTINLLGAFLIGVIVELMALKLSAPTQLRFLLVTGFLGGFTTFSAFSLEAALMLQKGDWRQMGCYVAASVIGTIGLVLAGTWLVRQMA